MGDEEDLKEYRWETGYEKTWEVIKEDADGRMEINVDEVIEREKRRGAERGRGARLGMMRQLYVVVDASEAMLDPDLKPTRQICLLKLLEGFIEEFLYENPLSQLGFILTRNKRAEKISELGGNGRKHIEALRREYGGVASCSGEPSVQNSLELALSSLRHMPSHASREVLLILGSLTTCDPSDINVTIQSVRTCGVRVSVIGVGAEVHVCREVGRQTGGDYSVLLDDVHLKHLLSNQLSPPLLQSASVTALVKMGFPHHAPTDSNQTSLAVCICHLEEKEGGKLEGGGYLCPQCRCKYCELPAECRVCGLTLVSAPHLARSYHHLFPLPSFIRQPAPPSTATVTCYACHVRITKHVYNCNRCHETFCSDCDVFIHDTLHTCPGCATNPDTLYPPIPNPT